MGGPDAAGGPLPGTDAGGLGLVRRYVSKMTGVSRAQSTRLLSLYLRGEEVKPKPYRRNSFAT